MGSISGNRAVGGVARSVGRFYFALDFIIESGTFNAFLLQEAMQLLTTTLMCARKCVESQAYDKFSKEADRDVFNPIMKNYFQQNWTLAFGRETWDLIFEKLAKDYYRTRPVTNTGLSG